MKKVLKMIVNLDIFISCVALVILIGVTFSNAILRYFFNAPYQWGEEVQMILIVWLIWFGGSCAFRSGNQICVDILLGLMPKFMQKVINVVIFLVSAVVLVFLMVQGMAYVEQLADTNRITETLHIPRAVIYSCMPVSCILMIGNMAYGFVKKWKGEEKTDE